MRGLLVASLLMFGSVASAERLDRKISEIILSKGTVLHVEKHSNALEFFVSYKGEVYACIVISQWNDLNFVTVNCLDSNIPSK